MEIANIMIAICLKVLMAMIFFKSCSQFADIPARKIVIEEEIEIIKRRKLLRGFESRISR